MCPLIRIKPLHPPFGKFYSKLSAALEKSTVWASTLTLQIKNF